jgi:ATP-binding cassette subfamily B protein
LLRWGSITQETLSVSGILLAKGFGRQAHEVERYSDENAHQAELQIRQAMVGRSFFAVTQAFFGVSPALVYLVAGTSCSRCRSTSSRRWRCSAASLS